jgi:ABC-2 type transport system permease protein
MRALRFLLRKEYLQIFRDKTLLRMLFLIPVVQLLVLSNAATFEVRQSRLFVVDRDRSTMSRGAIDRLVASGAVRAHGGIRVHRRRRCGHARAARRDDRRHSRRF